MRLPAAVPKFRSEGSHLRTDRDTAGPHLVIAEDAFDLSAVRRRTSSELPDKRDRRDQSDGCDNHDYGCDAPLPLLPSRLIELRNHCHDSSWHFCRHRLNTDPYPPIRVRHFRALEPVAVMSHVDFTLVPMFSVSRDPEATLYE